MSESWIARDYANALAQLEEALATPAQSDLLKAGCIQYFEFCFELAWKSIRQAGTSQGLADCLSPKACLRQAFANEWIDDEAIWLEMLEARNRMSHTYNARKALKIYVRLSPFLLAMKVLSARLEELS